MRSLVLHCLFLACHLCFCARASGAPGLASHRYTKEPIVLSRKLSLERNEQLSVPDTPGLWPPSWHTESALCPNIPSASPFCRLLASGMLEGPLLPSLWHTQVLGRQPQHTGCLACQLRTLAKTPCLEPGLGPPFLSWWKGMGRNKVTLHRKREGRGSG